MSARDERTPDSLEALIGEMADTPPVPPGIAVCPLEQARVSSMTLAEAIGEEFRDYTFELPENPLTPPEEIHKEALALLDREESDSGEPELPRLDTLSDDELDNWLEFVLYSGI